MFSGSLLPGHLRGPGCEGWGVGGFFFLQVLFICIVLRSIGGEWHQLLPGARGFTDKEAKLYYYKPPLLKIVVPSVYSSLARLANYIKL